MGSHKCIFPGKVLVSSTHPMVYLYSIDATKTSAVSG